MLYICLLVFDICMFIFVNDVYVSEINIKLRKKLRQICRPKPLDPDKDAYQSSDKYADQGL